MADTQDLNPDFMHRLNLLIQASGGSIYIVSGARTTERQQQLWDAAVKKYGSAEAARKWVAPPGHSNHERGIAADLGGNLKLAHSLAPQFGLNFPMGHEAWHIEPVGTRSTSSPMAYTPPPDQPDATQAPPADDPHDVGTQIGNFMASVMGSTSADPTLDPSSTAYGMEAA